MLSQNRAMNPTCRVRVVDEPGPGSGEFMVEPQRAGTRLSLQTGQGLSPSSFSPPGAIVRAGRTRGPIYLQVIPDTGSRCFPFCPHWPRQRKALRGVDGDGPLSMEGREGVWPPLQSSRLRGLQAGRGSGESQ